MGNALPGLRRRRSRSIRVMRMDGHVFKIRAPATAADVLTGHPGHVLLHSEALRHLGVRAAPLHASAELAPRNLYVLVQAELLPRARPRGVRTASDVSGSALSRLNALLLQLRRRRSLSDVAASAVVVQEPLRLKLRLSKAELAELMACATATSASRNDHVVSTSSSGCLAPPKTALRTIPESCSLPHSRVNDVIVHKFSSLVPRRNVSNGLESGSNAQAISIVVTKKRKWLELGTEEQNNKKHDEKH